MEDGWVAAGGAGHQDSRTSTVRRHPQERAHSAAVVGIICGTVLLVALDALSPGRMGGDSMDGGRSKSSSSNVQSLSSFDRQRLPTSTKKLEDMKSGRLVKGSMLAEGLQEGNASDHKIELQPSPAGPLAHVIFRPPAGVDYKVKVDVYIESLSPACKVFTEWVLVSVVGGVGLLDIMELRMIPWGKAELLQDKNRPTVVLGEGNTTRIEGGVPKFLCEHGAAECEGNAWISCVQALYPEVHQWFRAVSCILSHSCADGEAPSVDSVSHTGSSSSQPCGGMPIDVAPMCINNFGGGMNLEEVRKCAYSAQGTKLLLDNMARTQALKPPAKFYPWVVVDGEALNSTQSLLLGKTVCDRYVRKVQPFVNRTVPEPLGCFFFPDEPPIFPQTDNNLTISLLWLGGAAFFVLGVAILAYWKWSNTVRSSQEGDYTPWGDAAAARG